MENETQRRLYRLWAPEKVIYGPYELPALVDYIRQRRLPATTWIFHERDNRWAEARELPELKPLFDRSLSRPGHLAGALKGGVDADVMLRINVLSGLKKDQLEAFLSYLEILTLESMSVAVREGERGDAMYLILEGELRVRVLRKGKESILATLKAGDFFGDISLLDEGPRSADVVANDRSTLLKISTTAFARIRNEAPALAEPFLHALSKILVGRLRILNKRYVDSLLMLRSLTATEPPLPSPQPRPTVSP